MSDDKPNNKKRHVSKERILFMTRRLEDKLDKMIGFYFQKTYIAASIYANLSTPINLIITIFTALMTAHTSSSSSFISDDMNLKINLITFLLSILNSYFTPQKEFNELNEYLVKWSDIGYCFETCIYTNNTYEEKVENYKKLLSKANELYKDQYIKKRNFLTDTIHTFIRTIFMESNDRWMKHGTFDFYEKLEEYIELDFDLEELKYNNRKASWFERMCSCFKCCFNCFNNKFKKTKKIRKYNHTESIVNTFDSAGSRVPDHSSPAPDSDGQPQENKKVIWNDIESIINPESDQEEHYIDFTNNSNKETNKIHLASSVSFLKSKQMKNQVQSPDEDLEQKICSNTETNQTYEQNNSRIRKSIELTDINVVENKSY